MFTAANSSETAPMSNEMPAYDWCQLLGMLRPKLDAVVRHTDADTYALLITWTCPALQAMRQVMPGCFDELGGLTLYRKRKRTVEPVIGQIKKRGFMALLLRGLEKVRHEWRSLPCRAMC